MCLERRDYELISNQKRPWTTRRFRRTDSHGSRHIPATKTHTPQPKSAQVCFHNNTHTHRRTPFKAVNDLPLLSQLAQVRLHHVQLLLTWNPYPPHSPRLLTEVLATTTKICITGGSSRAHATTFNAHRYATLLVGASRLEKFFGNALKPFLPPTAVHRERALVPSIFRVARFGRISCYTLLSGCQLP